jgi:hypothetical protein
MKEIPSSGTEPILPLSTRIAIAALQSPSVGRSAMFEVMHGQMNAQLQVSMYSPAMRQSAMLSSTHVGVSSGSYVNSLGPFQHGSRRIRTLELVQASKISECF